MIITNLKGGLGNQMFQYALARKLALKNNDTFKLDISSYSHILGANTPRRFDLQHFNIIQKIATPAEIKALKYPYGLLSKASRRFKSKILKIHHIGFEPNLLKKTGDFYLDGFFQSEQYFVDIRDILIQDFSLKNGFGTEAQKFARDISSTSPSVSIHIRRGDYVTDPKTNKYNGVCPPEYYAKAIEYILKKFPQATFYIFSDDIDWVKKQMLLPRSSICVSQPHILDHEELMLMSLCQHTIIANSTFSWWAAWLNQNPNKIVIVPKQWRTKPIVADRDIVPASWLIL